MASSFIVSSLWSFHDTEEVLVSAELREGRLVVQVEENLTADQWRGQFDKKRKSLLSTRFVLSQAAFLESVVSVQSVFTSI